MNRRGRVAVLVGVLLLLGLAVGGGLPASGNQPEGGDGYLINVEPSVGLPLSSTVIVSGEGFVPDGTTPNGNVVQVAQCTGFGCGPETAFPVDVEGVFSGSFTVVRMLTLSDTTVDCIEVACVVRPAAADLPAIP